MAADSVGDARPGMSRGTDPRQYLNQLGQLTADTQGFRRELQQSGGSADDLQNVDQILRDLRAASNGQVGQNAAGLQQLLASALDKMKKLEFDLRKRTDTTSDQLFLSAGDDVPPKYRDSVSEYTRELSRRSGSAAPTPNAR
jgi:hypothetical protein